MRSDDIRSRIRRLALVMVTVLGLHATAAAQSVVENPHGAIEEPCGTCHAATGWTPARIGPDFDHARSGFALEQAHAGLDCADCHASLQFSGVGTDCADCHLDVHGGELGVDCARCHAVSSFIDVARQRALHRTARFALTGAHAGLDCDACHPPLEQGALRFLGISTECIDCHRASYEAATDPDHVAGAFVSRCDACHGTAAWAGGFFNHERQLGPGAVCVDCHRDDYDAATDPPHTTSAFPLECQVCHNTRDWRGSFLLHDAQWFPIFAGRHAQEWNTCSDCHTVPTDYTSFDCLGCHPHNDRTKTDADHDGEAEYRYDSITCLQCHPRGQE